MNLNSYSYFSSDDFYDYSFYSEGPNGSIKKIVTYSKMSEHPVVYNLAFGDEDSSGKINDNIISNNNDRDLVLSTVAVTIITFCKHHGNHFIYATGNTDSRTRLYQISIARLWDEINIDFEVYGFKDGDWRDFEKNVNYEAFLVKLK